MLWVDIDVFAHNFSLGKDIYNKSYTEYEENNKIK